ncbi:general odorant-binding protein 19d-like [Schistocerca serialis cubense]|uniref:general odorant-binding protein 19d-like n=1 Tax=Schistocerca serialis cubense TaxID=2023355 RepID=UPI00214E95AF|nr:general odorant-binding protein 19d-like [Schistocerca serialis cubense]
MRTSAAATGAALLVFVAVVSAMEMTPEFMEIVNKCKAEHEPTEDELKGIMMMKVPESEHGKCFMGCVLQEVGVVKDGKFDKEEAKKHAAAKMSDKDELEKHMQLIDKCSQEVDGETDSCGIGPKLMECIKQFAPEFDIALPHAPSE